MKADKGFLGKPQGFDVQPPIEIFEKTPTRKYGGGNDPYYGVDVRYYVSAISARASPPNLQ